MCRADEALNPKEAYVELVVKAETQPTADQTAEARRRQGGDAADGAADGERVQREAALREELPVLRAAAAGAKMAEALAEGTVLSGSLVELHTSDVQIGDAGMASVLESLKGVGLQELRIEKTNMDKTASAKLEEILTEATTFAAAIKLINIRACCGGNAQKRLKQACEAKEIKILTATHNDV